MRKIIPVILCGGSGTRLWPLSRQNTPKQFLKLMDDHTLLQKTAQRTASILGSFQRNLVTVTLESMAEETKRQLKEACPEHNHHILLEPEARNTAAAVAYALYYVAEQFGDDAYAWILPADHYIGNEQELKSALEKAEQAGSEGYLVTFGIQPTRPETGYGYIRKADSLFGQDSFNVRQFVEKPELEIAREYVSSGEFLWSSGMHLICSKTGIANYKKFAPETWNTVCASLKQNWNKPDARVYGTVEKQPFETAVLEKAQRVAVVPCDPQWSDIGSWESLWEIRGKDMHGNAMDGNVYCQSTTNSMILSQGRLVTCVGLKDVIVIETGDSVLVADKSANGSLKDLVNILRDNRRRETMISDTDHHTWGFCRTLVKNPKSHIREHCIKANATCTALQESGMSQWMATEGDGVFLINGEPREIHPEETIMIPPGTKYQIVNMGTSALRLYEINMAHSETDRAEDEFELPHLSVANAARTAAA